jgi:hypothetical protein
VCAGADTEGVLYSAASQALLWLRLWLVVVYRPVDSWGATLCGTPWSLARVGDGMPLWVPCACAVLSQSQAAQHALTKWLFIVLDVPLRSSTVQQLVVEARCLSEVYDQQPDRAA